MTTAFYNLGMNLTDFSRVESKKNKAQEADQKSVGGTDLELIGRINKGTDRQRETAFAALYTRYQHMVFTVAMRVVTNESDAENIVQDTFIKVNSNIHKFRGDSSVSTWLHTIAHNTALNYKAYESRRPQSSGKDPGELGSSYFERVRAEHTPQSEYENAEIQKRLNKAIQSLSDELKQTLLMVVNSGFSYEQVAKITDVPVGTVRSRVFRARQAVDKLIMED